MTNRCINSNGRVEGLHSRHVKRCFGIDIDEVFVPKHKEAQARFEFLYGIGKHTDIDKVWRDREKLQDIENGVDIAGKRY